jgi:Transposase
MMWRFTRNNGITEGFHNKMETINRVAYGFRNFENYRLRVKVLCFLGGLDSGVCPRFWRRAFWRRAGVLVDLVRFELTTSSMPWKRAPNCATGPLCECVNQYITSA